MDVFEAARTVLAVRQYVPRPVPPAIARKILDAGRLTGSSMNGQPWHFVVVDRPEALEALAQVAATGRFISQAGLAIAVAIDKTEYAVSDASRAIQSMILTAWSEGVASNWAGFFRLEQAKNMLGIPEQLDLFAIVAFGYAATPPSRGMKKRRALSEVAHYGRFGNPFAG